MLNDMDCFFMTPVETQEPNEMLDSFIVGGSSVDSSSPVMLRLYPAIQG